MDRLRRRPEPAAIDITWLSCRGVRSSLPFHKPCLYASISVVPSSAGKIAHGYRRPHRVKTPTDRAGGRNPEWDTPLRLYLPVGGASPPAPDDQPGARQSCKKVRDDDVEVLILRFEVKAEVAVLGDVLAASAAVPVTDLIADGLTRRVSYQLVGPDGRQPNGVISFIYTFQDSNSDDDGGSSSSDRDLAVTTFRPTAAASAVALPPPTNAAAAAPSLYPAIEWTVTDQVPVYPPAVTSAMPTTAKDMLWYPPPQPAVPAVYPPLAATSPCFVYPNTATKSASGIYPTVDLAPLTCCYPPPPPPQQQQPLYGVGFGYEPAPGWDDRCLHYG